MAPAQLSGADLLEESIAGESCAFHVASGGHGAGRTCDNVENGLASYQGSGVVTMLAPGLDDRTGRGRGADPGAWEARAWNSSAESETARGRSRDRPRRLSAVADQGSRSTMILRESVSPAARAR
jgi:hypothetical protein